MCRKHGIPDTPEVYALYHNINLELWAAFDRGEVSKDFVTLERYIRFLKALDLKPIRPPATVTIWRPWGSAPTPALRFGNLQDTA